MALLLHPSDLSEEGLVILLHFVDLQLLLVLLRPVVVPPLLHLPQLHLSALDLALELLDLPLVTVVELQLLNLPLELLNQRSPRTQLALHNLCLVLEALDLVLQSFHRFHDVGLGRPARALIVGLHQRTALIHGARWTSEALCLLSHQTALFMRCHCRDLHGLCLRLVRVMFGRTLLLDRRPSIL